MSSKFHPEGYLEISAYKWMQREIEDYRRHGGNNITQFVENCVHEFDTPDHDEWLDDPNHWIWEMALDFFDEV